MCQICAANPMSFTGGSAAGSSQPSFASATMDLPQAGGAGSNFWAFQGATGDQNINGLLSGSRWGGGTVTYSFPTAANLYEGSYSYDNEPQNSFMSAPEAVRVATRAALNLVSQYTNLITTEVAPTITADIRSAFSGDPSTAWGYYPGNVAAAGDVWYGRIYPEYQNPTRGQYAWATVLHELGHALGLKHGHEGEGVANTALQSNFDQMAFSLMTYRSYAGASVTGGYTNELNGYAQTYMIYDIAALQTMYGANFNTNAGNTTYSWSPTTGEMFINGVGQGAPGGNRVFLTVWDGNGNDTYDFSNYASNLSINLNPGAFSVTSAEQLANLGFGNMAPGNVFNALQYNGDTRSLIENANGGSGNDRITGNAANNTLNGNTGADVLLGMSGADRLIGGLGADALIGDGPVVWDENAAAVRRLYIATLNRAPDDGGHQGWAGALAQGQSLQQITTGFINSQEFSSAYGSLSNAQFVTLLYNNVLKRAPDAGGLSGWVGSLNSGASRESVVAGFSESVEFRGYTDVREHAGQIFRLYDTAFNRTPDAGGFSGWIDYRYGGADLRNVANQFMGSVEFTNTYGNIGTLSNTQFVTLLYNNVLDRAPDSGGLSGWVSALNAGTLSRADVLLQFSDSTEHIGLMNNGLGTFMRTTMSNWTDVLEGGPGNDILTGGRGADRFVFNNSDGGTDTIYGFEVFDTLDFRGFGYTTAAHVLANVAQQGSNVVFNNGLNSIIFQDTQLSVLHSVTAEGWIFA